MENWTGKTVGDILEDLLKGDDEIFLGNQFPAKEVIYLPREEGEELDEEMIIMHFWMIETIVLRKGERYYEEIKKKFIKEDK